MADMTNEDPRCEKCGLECTTGMMAAFCSQADQCEFWPHSDGTPAGDGGELFMAKAWMQQACQQIGLQIEDRKRLEREVAQEHDAASGWMKRALELEGELTLIRDELRLRGFPTVAATIDERVAKLGPPPSDVQETDGLRAIALDLKAYYHTHRNILTEFEQAFAARIDAALASPADCDEIRRLLAEARCPADFCNGKGEVERYRTGTGMVDRTNCTWCAVRAAALGWVSVAKPQQIGASGETHARGGETRCRECGAAAGMCLHHQQEPR